MSDSIIYILLIAILFSIYLILNGYLKHRNIKEIITVKTEPKYRRNDVLLFDCKGSPFDLLPHTYALVVNRVREENGIWLYDTDYFFSFPENRVIKKIGKAKNYVVERKIETEIEYLK